MAHLFAVALCLAALVASSFAAFDGVWVDNDQRVLTLCTTDSGTKLQGSYQEIGLFQGTVSGNTASGTFYLASSPDFVCTRRSFSWRLSTSNNELNGTWSCVDNGGINGHWNAVRQSSFSTHQTCGVLASSGSLAGRWNLGTNVDGNTWDFCVETTNGGKYQSSYEFIGATTGKPGRGYSHGESFENGRLLIGTWSEAVNVLTSDNHAGFNIIGLGEDGQLFEYYWLLPLDDSDVIALTPGKHGTQRVARFSTSLRDTTDCLRNQGTAVNFSDASSIGMSLVLVATVVVALFSLWL